MADECPIGIGGGGRTSRERAMARLWALAAIITVRLAPGLDACTGARALARAEVVSENHR
jgi:hypothetical protein